MLKFQTIGRMKHYARISKVPFGNMRHNRIALVCRLAILFCFIYTSYHIIYLVNNFNNTVKDRAYRYSSIPIYNQMNDFQVLSPASRYSEYHLRNMTGSTPTDKDLVNLLTLFQSHNVILLDTDLLYSLGPSIDYFKTFKKHYENRTLISFGIYKNDFPLLNSVRKHENFDVH